MQLGNVHQSFNASMKIRTKHNGLKSRKSSKMFNQGYYGSITIRDILKKYSKSLCCSAISLYHSPICGGTAWGPSKVSVRNTLVPVLGSLAPQSRRAAVTRSSETAKGPAMTSNPYRFAARALAFPGTAPLPCSQRPHRPGVRRAAGALSRRERARGARPVLTLPATHRRVWESAREIANRQLETGNPNPYGIWNSCPSGRTLRTAQGALRTTFSATLPKSAWLSPVRPWVAMQIRSIAASFA